MGTSAAHSDSGSKPEAGYEIQKARAAAYRLLAARAYTRAEIEKKLRARRFGKKTISETVLALEEMRLLDDRAFALQWVQMRLQGRPMGRIRLARELRNRGVPDELVQEALEEALAEVDPDDQALGLLRERANRYRGVDRQKALSRMFQFLGRRGFSVPVARGAAETVWAELAEGQEEADWT